MIDLFRENLCLYACYVYVEKHKKWFIKNSNRENQRMKNKWQTVTELDIYLLTREQGKKRKKKIQISDLELM